MLVVDESGRYGGELDGSLDLMAFHSKYPDADISHEITDKDRKGFLIDTRPRLLAGGGSMCKRLVAEGVAKYLEFRPIASCGLITADGTTMVPMTKEDIFADTSLSLIEKRQLSKLVNLQKGSGPFMDQLRGLPTKLTDLILYSVLLCNSRDEATMLSFDDALERVQRFRESLRQYGAPFLYPAYGSSELAQAYCRKAAVDGGVFVMGQNPTIKDEADTHSISGTYDDRTWRATFSEMHSSNEEQTEIQRAVIILDSPFIGERSSSMWTIIDGDVIVRLLCLASDSSCAPAIHQLLHVWSHQDCDLQSILQKHINIVPSAGLGLPNALFQAYFHGPAPTLAE